MSFSNHPNTYDIHGFSDSGISSQLRLETWFVCIVIAAGPVVGRTNCRGA